MLTLDLTNAPRWHDLAAGVRVQLRPLTTALMVATRSDPAVEATGAPNAHRATRREIVAIFMAAPLGAVAWRDEEALRAAHRPGR